MECEPKIEVSPEQIFKNHFLSQVYASFVTKLEENQALLGVVKRLPMLPSKTSALGDCIIFACVKRYFQSFLS